MNHPPSESAVPVAVPVSASRKVRRDLSFMQKHEALLFNKNHSVKETLAKFPELSRATLFRMKKQGHVFAKAVHAQRAHVKRIKPLAKYRVLGEHVNEFFISVREAHGAVTRALLESFIGTLPSDIESGLLSRQLLQLHSATYTTANGWMNAEVFLRHCQKTYHLIKTLLIVDLFAAHRCNPLSPLHTHTHVHLPERRLSSRL